MTDSQAINSSVLAEYLDVLKQMQKSLQAHAVHTEYKSTQAYLARAMDTQLYSLIPNCDALRALVVEQEQASAGEAISLSDAQKLAQDISERAKERREEFRATNANSPQFAVGDTVAYGKSKRHCIIKSRYERGDDGDDKAWNVSNTDKEYPTIVWGRESEFTKLAKEKQ